MTRDEIEIALDEGFPVESKGVVYRQMHGETEEQLTDIKCSLRSLFRYVKEDLQ